MELSEEDLELLEKVYLGQDVTIWKGRVKDSRAEVIIKILTTISRSELETLRKEVEFMKKLEHENIVQIYSWFYKEIQRKYEIWIVMENCTDGDLGKLIYEAKFKNQLFEEEVLLTMMKQLVTVFAYMQKKGFAHRDIKPQNIFLSENKVIKIGDFGSSYEIGNRQIDERTLQGTPAYLSPLCREVLGEYLKGGIPYVRHNVIKSDVYSLGMTFITLCDLDSVNSLIHEDLEVLQQRITERISQLSYSDRVKEIIAKMTFVKEDQRLDFVALEREYFSERPVLDPFKTNSKLEKNVCRKDFQRIWNCLDDVFSLSAEERKLCYYKVNFREELLISYLKNLCEILNEELIDRVCLIMPKIKKSYNVKVSVLGVICNLCNANLENPIKVCCAFYHEDCLSHLSGNPCTKCKTPINLREHFPLNCELCHNPICRKPRINSSHNVCVKCRPDPVFELVCQNPNCESQNQIATELTFTCSVCRTAVCSICKSLPHPSKSCKTAKISSLLKCYNCRELTQRQPNTQFYFCETCKGLLCFICNNPHETNQHDYTTLHKQCLTYFESSN